MVVVSIVLAVVILVSVLRLRSVRRRARHEPPMLPGALPFIGHAHRMLGSTTNLWKKLQILGEESLKRMEPFSIMIGTTKVYILSDPDDSYTVAKFFFEKPPVMFEFTKILLGEGLLCNKPPTWQRHRRLMNQMFSQRILDGFIKMFNANARELVRYLSAFEGKGDFDPNRCMRKAAVTNTFATLTGTTRYNKDERLRKVFDALYVLPEVTIKRVKKIWLYRHDIIFNWSILKRRQDEAINVIKDVTEQIYKEKRIDLHKKSEDLAYKGIGDEGIESFLELFMQREDKGLSRKEIFDEINTLILSSFDTSALGLIYALVRIGSNPHMQERLYEEIKENSSFDYARGFEINKMNLLKLVYLDAVIKESLRMHTVIPIISRHLDKDIKLKHYTLYKGNECFILTNALHRHPLWGLDAHEFKPERWLNPETSHTHLFAGFGIGKRNCIGKVYAMLQMKIQLAHILLHYKVCGDDSQIVHKYEMLLEPAAGHHISIVKR